MIIVCEQEWGDFDNIGCITSKRCCKEVCPVLILKNGSWWICLCLVMLMAIDGNGEMSSVYSWDLMESLISLGTKWIGE